MHLDALIQSYLEHMAQDRCSDDKYVEQHAEVERLRQEQEKLKETQP